jgi:hypothetical protein
MREDLVAAGIGGAADPRGQRRPAFVGGRLVGEVLVEHAESTAAQQGGCLLSRSFLLGSSDGR